MKPSMKGLQNVYLHPGEACFSGNPIVVSTVLGSCLSITMFSRKTKYAGISHCQLPNCKTCNAECDDCPEPFKYVNCTIRVMLQKFGELHIDKKDIEVKIFGGADVLKPTGNGKRVSTVGKQNIQSAVKTLAENNMYTTASDVGGPDGRKIIFFTGTGEIYLNRMKSNG